MKLLITLIVFCLLSHSNIAQISASTTINRMFLCESDSLANDILLKLKNNNIDSVIILITYDFVPTIRSRQVILWVDKNRNNVRIIEGCQKIKRDSSFTTDLTDIIAFSTKYKFKLKSKPTSIKDTPSRLYTINILLPSKTLFFKFKQSDLIDSKRKNFKQDNRQILVSMIEGLAD